MKKYSVEEDLINSMECPCKCDCGNWFDLEDGYGCYSCSKTVCPDCMDDEMQEKCNKCVSKGKIDE